LKNKDERISFHEKENSRQSGNKIAALREENCLQLVRDFLAGSHKILLGRYTARFSVSTNSRRNVRLKAHLTFRQVKHNRHGSLTMHVKISPGIRYLFFALFRACKILIYYCWC